MNLPTYSFRVSILNLSDKSEAEIEMTGTCHTDIARRATSSQCVPTGIVRISEKKRRSRQVAQVPPDEWKEEDFEGQAPGLPDDQGAELPQIQPSPMVSEISDTDNSALLTTAEPSVLVPHAITAPLAE